MSKSFPVNLTAVHSDTPPASNGESFREKVKPPHIKLELAEGLSDEQKQAMIGLRYQFNTCAAKAGVNVEMMGSHRSPAKPFKMHGANAKFLLNADPDATLAASRKAVDLEGVLYEQLAHARSGNFEVLAKTARLYEILHAFRYLEPLWKAYPEATSRALTDSFGSLAAFQQEAQRIRNFLPDFVKTDYMLRNTLHLTDAGTLTSDLTDLIVAQTSVTREQALDNRKAAEEKRKVLAVKNYLKNSLPAPEELRDFSDKLIKTLASLTKAPQGSELTTEAIAARAPMFHINNRDSMLQMENFIRTLHQAETFAADAYATRHASNPHALVDYLAKGKIAIGADIQPSFPTSELQPSDVERIARMRKIIAEERLMEQAPISYTQRHNQRDNNNSPPTRN